MGPITWTHAVNLADNNFLAILFACCWVATVVVTWMNLVIVTWTVSRGNGYFIFRVARVPVVAKNGYVCLFDFYFSKHILSTT
jgi:hypothetical protein